MPPRAPFFVPRLGCLLSLAFALAGCTSLSPEKQAERNRQLDDYRAGLKALRSGDLVSARQRLDSAVLTLGGLSVGDKTAKEARNYFKEESRKNFRGEPYERAMAFYYRGLLYWMDGEPDNARACFRSAAVQDMAPEIGITEADWTLLDYLDGLATVKLRGDGKDQLKRARKSARLNPPPDYDGQANVLVFLECGTGPTKYSAGEYGEQLRFRPGSAPGSLVQFVVNGQTNKFGPYDDLTYQATTRGGRLMDHILAGKAVFKTGADSFGDAAVVSGAILAIGGQGSRGAADEIGFGLLAAGLISKAVSAATTPAADTRTWDNLPNFISFAALRLAPGPHTAQIQFQTQTGQPVTTRAVTFTVAPDRDTVLFVSDRNL
jgi:hypothetical protein